MVSADLIQSGPEERMMEHWQEGKNRAILSFFFFPSLHPYLFLSPSQTGLSGVRKKRRRKRAFFFPPSSPTTSELPAGSELFYALVVTGRFIRLEICTNQLSFSGSCQCVKLSGPAVREMP